MTTMMVLLLPTSKIEADVGNDDVDGGINAEIAERILQPSPSSCRIGIAGSHTTMPCHTMLPWYFHTVVLPCHAFAIPWYTNLCHTIYHIHTIAYHTKVTCTGIALSVSHYPVILPWRFDQIFLKSELASKSEKRKILKINCSQKVLSHNKSLERDLYCSLSMERTQCVSFLFRTDGYPHRDLPA